MILKMLRWYTGVALLGAVLAGLILGWTPFANMAEWIGALAAVFIFAFIDYHKGITCE